MKFIPVNFTLIAIITLWIGCSSTRTYQKVNHVVYPEHRLPESTQTIKVLHSIRELPSKNTLSNRPTNTSADVKVESPNEVGGEAKTDYLVRQTMRELEQGQFYLIERIRLSDQELAEWSTNKIKDYTAGGGDVMLVLDHLQSDYDFKSEKIRKHQLDASGKDYYLDAFEATRHYVVRTDWNVYSSDPVKLLYNLDNRGERKLTTQGLNKDQTIQKLDSIARGVERYLLDSMAQVVASQILPRKIFDSWTYYVKGSEELEHGYKFMKLDKLEESERIYLEALGSTTDSKVEARLNYNLAVINDILGDINTAFEFAEKALLTDDKYLHQKLYDDLKIKKGMRY